MSTETEELLKVVEHGIRLCREGKWQKGMEFLRPVADTPEAKEDREGTEALFPGRFFSYLGYGIARYDKRYNEGLELCKRAVKVEFYVGENYLNLARTYLLLRSRSPAVAAVERGLKVDPNNLELQELQQRIGKRRRPLLGFLPRAHPLNRRLGMWRHKLLNRRARKKVVVVSEPESQ